MLGALVVLLIAIPIAELYVIVQVAHHIGLIETLALLIVLSVTGGWLLKREGLATWMRMQETLRAGRMPGKEVTDGALILLGGALLLTPGFITDVAGLLLLLPPTRALLKGTSSRVIARWARRRSGAVRGPRIYATTARRADDVNRSTEATFPREPRPVLGPHDEGGSRDTE